MKLKLISEIQYKRTDTVMNRAGPLGAYAQSSVNDLYRHIKKIKKDRKLNK